MSELAFIFDCLFPNSNFRLEEVLNLRSGDLHIPIMARSRRGGQATPSSRTLCKGAAGHFIAVCVTRHPVRAPLSESCRWLAAIPRPRRCWNHHDHHSLAILLFDCPRSCLSSICQFRGTRSQSEREAISIFSPSYKPELGTQRSIRNSNLQIGGLTVHAGLFLKER